MAGANKTALNAQPLTQGYCWFTTEDGKFYIDALADQQDTTTLTRFVLNAEKADKDGDGKIIKNTYLPLAGGTLTGDLNSKLINMYLDAEIAPVNSQSISFYTTNKRTWVVNSGNYRINYYSTANTLTGGIHYNHPKVSKFSTSTTYSAQVGTFSFKTRNIQENSTSPYASTYTTFILTPPTDFNSASTSYYIPYIASATRSEGTENKPVYLDGCILKTCSQYAGGTAVTLNGESKGASTASFYAPTAMGTLGQFLQSNGSGAPTWVDLDPGVKSISTGETNGTISVNTNGTVTEVAVKGLGSNAFSSIEYLPLAGGTLTGDLTATSFSGIGTNLTALNASNISSGTVAADRLPDATTSAKGIVKIGTGISVSSGTISVSGLAVAQASTPGEQYTLWIDTDEEAQAAMPLNGPKHKTFSITTSNWSGSGPYTYNLTMNGVTSSDAVIVLNLDASSQAHLKAQLDWETTTNTVKLSTSVKPTGTISGYLITLPVTSV